MKPLPVYPHGRFGTAIAPARPVVKIIESVNANARGPRREGPSAKSFRHSVPVRHIQSGMEFAMIRDAADYFGINSAMVGKSVRFGDKTSVGTFERVKQ